MSPEVIAFGSDHAGFTLKNMLKEAAQVLGYQALDFGTDSTSAVDYPDLAAKVVEGINRGQAALGVLVCGTGLGMCMAANRHVNIRAAHVHTELEARLARQHNNANILCLGARIVGSDQAKACLAAFLKARFAGGRHNDRIEKFS